MAHKADNFASMKFVDVTFEAGKAEAVEIEFGTWSNWSYYLTVFADNTRVEITVNP